MSNPTDSATPSDVAWTSSDHHSPVPNTSLLPGAEQAPAPAIGLMKRVVRGAHETIDQLADSAAPTVRQLGERMSGAEDAMHAKTAQLRVTRDEWAESVRVTVRSHPLVSVAAALALGAFVARISRGLR